jgi:hypothetical protein
MYLKLAVPAAFSPRYRRLDLSSTVLKDVGIRASEHST